MNRRIARAALVGAVVSALGLTVPISAAQATSSAAAADPTSATEAGYSLTAAPSDAQVVDKFTVPSVTCNAGVQSGMSIGSFIFLSSVGGVSFASVNVNCEGIGSNTPEYSGDLTINGGGRTTLLVPKPGDKIVATVSENATNASATLRDITQNKTRVLTGAGGTNSAALWGIWAPGLPVPTFTTIKFNVGRLNGSNVSTTGAVALSLEETTTVDIQTGALNTRSGWKEVWEANS